MKNNNIYKILVVDDDAYIVELLKYNLQKENYTVATASNGKEAIEVAKQFEPHIILMDIMMPELDGVETSRILREQPEIADVFIIFLTARAEEYSEIAAFDVGADDYITKPIKPRALMRRINAVVRRHEKRTTSNNVLHIKDLIIDKDSYLVKRGNEEFSLPKKEFDLLFFLATNPDKVFSREELLKNVWGEDIYVIARTVDVHIRKVREKIGDDFIKTIKGVGYKFVNL